MTHEIWLAAALILLRSLPFGLWRVRARKLSVPWFLAIHVPVLLAIALRLLMGIGFRLATLPIFVGAFAAGQFLGGRLDRLGGRGAGGA